MANDVSITPESQITADGILDLFDDDSTDDDVKIDDKKVEVKEDEEDTKLEVGDEEEEDTKKEAKETDEEELELKDDEEPDDDDLDLVAPSRRKEILAKYPEFFKDFPSVEKSYYRDQKFTEMFATPEDAADVKERAESLDTFEAQLLAGDSATILKSVKESDPEAFNRIADNYLQSLANTDQDAYYTVVGNVAKNFITGMVQEANRTKNEKLTEAAVIVNQFIFGTSEYKNPVKLANPNRDTTAEDNLREEKEAFAKQKFESAETDITGRIENTLKSTVDGAIDPRGLMTDYVKKHAVQEVMGELQELLSEDSRFSNIMDKLWERAYENDYSPSSMKKIRSTYLAKSRTELPSIIKKSRSTALKGLGRVEKPKKDVSDETRQVSNKGIRTTSSKNNKDGVGMSTLDFFNQD